MLKKLLLAFGLLITLNVSAQTNLYVDSAVATSGTGTSWAAAKKTLSEALTVANAGNTANKYIINIAKGTYYPTGVQSATNRDSAFNFNRGGIKLVAGYPSGGGTINTITNKVVLSGNINNAIDYSDNSYHVIVIAGIPNLSDTISISGLTISDAYASGNGTKTYRGIPVQRYNGAGVIVATDSNVVLLSNCILSGNWANGNPSNGGALYNFGSNVYLNSCAFTGNICNGPNASHSGGAVYNEQTAVTINNCMFSGNIGSSGGAMYSLLTQASITGSTFDNNRGRNGGAVYHQYSPTTIMNSQFVHDTATNKAGGLYQDGSTVTMTNCQFTGNTANDYATGTISSAGGAYLSFGTSIITNCIFTGNYGAFNTGGLHANQDTLTLTGSTFTGNTCGSAIAALEVSSSLAAVSNCTFTGNSSPQGPGAVALELLSSGSTFTANTLTGNRGQQGGGLNVYYCPGTTISRCLIKGNTAISGGGIYTFTYSTNPINATFDNCLISGNKALSSGGGMYNSGSSPIVTNCTFAGDSALTVWGVHNVGVAANSVSNPTFTNCIMWDGLTAFVNGPQFSTPVVTFSDISQPTGVYPGVGNINSNPLFVNPIPAGSAPATVGDYSLLPCSPVINAGSNIGGSYSGINDVAGNPRLFGATVDMGAFEYQSAPATPGAITGNSTVCVNSTIQLANTTLGGSWASSNTSIATVSTSGLVTGIAAGTDTISYNVTSGGCSSVVTKIITVNALPSIAAIASGNAVCVGGTAQLTNATGSGVWTSSNANIATVNAAGLITGVAAGTDTISYTITNTNGCSNSSRIVITVNPLPVPGGITGNTTVCANATTQLSNATSGGGWTSSNNNIATVGTTGIVTGIAAGTTLITYSITNANGCTGTVTTTVTVQAMPAQATLTGPGTACVGTGIQLTASTGGGTWNSGNNSVSTIDANGNVTPIAPGTVTVSYTITSGNGCTSITNKVLTIGTTYNRTETATICQGSQYQFGGQTLTTAGVYSHHFQTSIGCDSLVALTLNVTIINAAIAQSGNTLTATPSGATYQWINCGTGNSPIPGATSQSFTPTVNGQYAVAVTQNGCSQTSPCKTITGLAVEGNNLLNLVRVYPNPSNDLIYITSDNLALSSIELKDVTGKSITNIIPTGKASMLSVSDIAPGLYLLVLHSGNQKFTRRIEVIR